MCEKCKVIRRKGRVMVICENPKLMLGILANDHDTAFTTDHLALLAHGLHGRSYFHFDKPPTYCAR